MERVYRPREDILFEDRQAAGRALAAALRRRGVRCSVVLGLPRGGVPVACEVAAALGAPVDVLVVKKLRAPISAELAIGAVCADGTRVLRRGLIRELGVSEAYLAREVRVRLREAREAEQAYRGGRPPLDLAGAAVVLVDDGMATGATMEAAVASARQRGAGSVLVAVPVASPTAWEALHSVADALVCLAAPPEFWAVGQFYRHFPPVPDEEVRRLLAEGRASRPAAGEPGR